MDIIGKLFMLFISASLINNIVFMRFLALCPFVGMSTQIETSVGMGLSLIHI